MAPAIRTIIYPVADVAAAKQRFTALLGVPPTMDETYYVQFDADGQEIGLDPNGHAKGMTGPLGYWHVVDIRASVQSLLDGGGEVRQEVTNVGGGRSIATVADPDGNLIGLVQPA